MKWLFLAICAEVGVLLCLIFSFDGALHSMQSARLTWDHAAVAAVYSYVRLEFSRRRMGKPTLVFAHLRVRQEVPPGTKRFPTESTSRQEAPPVRIAF